MPRSLFEKLEELLPNNRNTDEPDPLEGIEQFAYSRQAQQLTVRLEGVFNLKQIEALTKVMREFTDNTTEGEHGDSGASPTGTTNSSDGSSTDGAA